MGVDFLRSFGFCKARLFSDSDREDWVRWYPCAPGAKLFPEFQAFGHAIWETEREDFDGPGMVGLFQQWAPTHYPSPVGDHFHGELTWFQNGLPLSELTSPTLPPDLTCRPPSPIGGGVCGGTAFPPQTKQIACVCLGNQTAIRSPSRCMQWWNTGSPVVDDPTYGPLSFTLASPVTWIANAPDGSFWSWSQLPSFCAGVLAGELSFSEAGFAITFGGCRSADVLNQNGVWNFPFADPASRIFGLLIDLLNTGP